MPDGHEDKLSNLPFIWKEGLNKKSNLTNLNFVTQWYWRHKSPRQKMLGYYGNSFEIKTHDWYTEKFAAKNYDVVNIDIIQISSIHITQNCFLSKMKSCVGQFRISDLKSAYF